MAGLVAVAVGDAAPEGLHWDGPGPVLFLLLALVSALVPGRSMIMLSGCDVSRWRGSGARVDLVLAVALWIRPDYPAGTPDLR